MEKMAGREPRLPQPRAYLRSVLDEFMADWQSYLSPKAICLTSFPAENRLIYRDIARISTAEAAQMLQESDRVIRVSSNGDLVLCKDDQEASNRAAGPGEMGKRVDTPIQLTA